METTSNNQEQRTKIIFSFNFSGYKLLKVLSIIFFVLSAILLIGAADGIYEYFDSYYGGDKDLYRGIIYLIFSMNSLISAALLLGLSTIVRTNVLQQVALEQQYDLQEDNN